MANIPITNQQVSLRGATADYAPDRVGGALGRTIDQAGNEAEDFLTRLAEQDAAVEGLNQLANFKIDQAKRLDDLQRSATQPDGFTPSALKDFDERSKEFLGGLGNKRVARFVEMRLPEVRGATAASALQWETSARQALRDQNFLESLNKYQTLSTMGLGNYEAAKADIMSVINAGGFDPVEASKRQTMAVRQLAKSAVFGEIDREPMTMLDRLNKGDFPELDADVRLQAIGAAQSEIARREAKGRADLQLDRSEKTAQLQAWEKDDIASRIDTGKGVPLPEGFTEEDLAGVLNPGQIVRLKEQQERADMLYRATADIKTQTVPQMLAGVEALKPQPGAQDYASKDAAYQMALKRVKQVRDARIQDASGAMRDAFPKVNEAFAKFDKSGEAADLQAAMAASLAAQRSVGLPESLQRPLEEDRAKTIAGNITGAPPDEAWDTLQAVRAKFGDWWGRAVRQLGPKLPPAYRIAVTMDDEYDAKLLIAMSRQPVAELRKGAGDAAKEINTAIAANNSLALLKQSFGPEGAQVGIDVTNALELLSLGRYTTLNDGDAVNNAVKSVIEEKYTFGEINGHPFAVVGNRYRNRVSDLTEAAQFAAKLAVKDKDLDLPALQPGVTVDAQREMYVSALSRNARWVTTPGGNGLRMLSDRGYPVSIKGKPVEYTWDQLLDLPKAFTPTPMRTLKELGGKGGPIGSPQELKYRAENPAEYRKATKTAAEPGPVVNYEPATAADPAHTGAAYSDNVVRSEPTGTPDPYRESVLEASKRTPNPVNVPAWMKDIERARAKSKAALDAAGTKYADKIAELKALYKKDRAKVMASPEYQWLKRNGLLSLIDG